MPTVQRFQQQVRPAPMPNARRSASLTPEAAGVQVARAEGDLAAAGYMGKARVADARADIAGRVGAISAALYEKLQQKTQRDADSAALLDAQVRLESGTQAYTEDPKEGVFYTRKGRQASTLLTEAMPKYDEIVSDATQDLSPHQKAAFAEWEASHRIRFSARLQSFVGRENEEWMTSVAQGAVEMHLQQATRSIASPKEFYSELSQAVNIIEQTGARKGLDVKAQVLKVQTAAHASAINTLLGYGQVVVATKWLNEAAGGNQIDPDQATALREKIKGVSLGKQGQEMADKAQGEGKTLTERLDLIRQWTAGDADPTGTIRQHAEEVLKGRHSVEQAETLDHERTTLRSGYDVINKTGTWTAIPKTILNDPKNAELVGHWKAYSKQQRDNAQPDRYGAKYLSLVRDSAVNPDKFKDVNLESVRYQMTREEFGALNELQADIIRGNAKAAGEKIPTIGQFEKTFELVLGQAQYDSLAISGSDKANKAKREEVFKIRQSVAQQIEDAQRPKRNAKDELIPGDRVTPEMVSKFIGMALTERVTAARTHWYSPGDEDYEQKPMIQMTIGDVPKASRKQIEAELEKDLNMTGPFSDALILNRYLTLFANRRKK